MHLNKHLIDWLIDKNWGLMGNAKYFLNNPIQSHTWFKKYIYFIHKAELYKHTKEKYSIII